MELSSVAPGGGEGNGTPSVPIDAILTLEDADGRFWTAGVWFGVVEPLNGPDEERTIQSFAERGGIWCRTMKVILHDPS